MRRAVLACALLLAAGAAVRVGRAGPRGQGTVDLEAASPPTVAPAPEPAPGPAASTPGHPLPPGNAAADRLAALELRVGMYRKALGNPSDEWIRLLNLIRITAEELRDPPASVLADGDRLFDAAGFARIRTAAQDLARVTGDYYEAARTRNVASVASLRPAFEAQWTAFRGAVSRGSRNP